MRRYDLWAASFLLLFGLGAALESWKLMIGEPGKPGPGFFPFYLALAFFVVSLLLLVEALLKGKRREVVAEKASGRAGGRKIAWTLLGLFVYAFVLETAGFLFATFLVMLFLFRAVDPLRWPYALGGSLASSFLTYAIFKLWLQVQLPAGPWGP